MSVDGGLPYSDHPITATSQVVEGTIEGTPDPQSRAAADPTKPMTLYLLRADETGKETGIYGSYGTTPLVAARPAGVLEMLTFDTEQFYLANEVRSRFTGWWPTAESFTGGVASWTIDGTTDVLTLAAQSGSMLTPLPNLVFKHALSQLQFWFYAADAGTQAAWGTITKITVKAQPTICRYTPSTDAPTGALTVDATPIADFAATNLITVPLPLLKTQMCDPVIIAPQAANTVITLDIETAQGVKVTLPLAAAQYLAGEAYRINLKFVSKQIESSATIGDWGTPIDVTVPVG